MKTKNYRRADLYNLFESVNPRSILKKYDNLSDIYFDHFIDMNFDENRDNIKNIEPIKWSTLTIAE